MHARKSEANETRVRWTSLSNTDEEPGLSLVLAKKTHICLGLPESATKTNSSLGSICHEFLRTGMG